MPQGMSDVADSAESSKGLGDLASGALDGLGGADEGAVVIIPVVAIFLIGAAILAGAGALAMLFFSWDVLLAVAVELAFPGRRAPLWPHGGTRRLAHRRRAPDLEALGRAAVRHAAGATI